MAIYTKNLESLSVQQLVDCAGPQGGKKYGCTGGNLDAVFQYVKSTGGIDTDAYYPYVGGEVHTNFHAFKTK